MKAAAIKWFGRAAYHSVINRKRDHSADDSNEHAVEIEARDRSRAEQREDITANHGTYNAEHGIDQQAFARFVDDHACNEPGDTAEDEPSND